MTAITGPAAFAALGFSGRFHEVTRFPDDETRDKYQGKTPCLLKDPGWMLLEVRADGLGVVIRRDGHAILDICVGRREITL